MGNRVRRRYGEPWEAGEDKYIVGVVREVATVLGRSPHSLAKRLERLAAKSDEEALCASILPE